MPAAIYKLARDDDLKDPNPILFSGGRAWTSSEQVQMPFLCADCEQMFGAGGERYVLSQCCRPEGFALRDGLKGRSPVLADDQIAVFDLEVGDENLEHITYFAASVFWRASAGRWKGDTGPLELISLGTKYEDEFGSYLLGKQSFPGSSILVLLICSEDKPFRGASFPVSDRSSGCFKHWFYMPGLMFTMFVGNRKPEQMRAVSLARGRAYVGPVTRHKVNKIMRDVIKTVTFSKKLKERYGR